MIRHSLTFMMVGTIVTGGTVAHGYVTGRWTNQTTNAELNLPPIPEVLGAWKGENLKSGLADDKHQKNLARRYVHTKSGRGFTISLTLGPAGLTAQHTPEYCYPSSGYQAVGATQVFMERDAQFRTAVYRKGAEGTNESVRILWAWSANGQWLAPSYPELTFVRGTLYKLYVVSSDTERAPGEDAELQNFMSQLLTTLGTTLFAKAD